MNKQKRWMIWNGTDSDKIDKEVLRGVRKLLILEGIDEARIIEVFSQSEYEMLIKDLSEQGWELAESNVHGNPRTNLWVRDFEEIAILNHLGKIMQNLPTVEYKPDGEYELFVSNESIESDTYTPQTEAMILFVSDNEELGYVPEAANKRNMSPIIDLQTLQEIIHVARDIRPNCDAVDLIKSLIYYLDHDGFYEFDDE